MDLAEITHFIALDNPARAFKFEEELLEHARRIERAFERFSQADTSDGRSRGGTGLGMAIAKHLTEQMSGRIGFESEENVGTIFHLEFPLASSEADAA
jgi:signal transduction histidine kinase